MSVEGHIKDVKEFLLPYTTSVAIVPLIGRYTLMIERSNTDPDGGQLITFPGGRLNPGETPIEAATRELSEETGINVNTNHLQKVKTFRSFEVGGKARGFINKIAYCYETKRIPFLGRMGWEIGVFGLNLDRSRAFQERMFYEQAFDSNLYWRKNIEDPSGEISSLLVFPYQALFMLAVMKPSEPFALSMWPDMEAKFVFHREIVSKISAAIIRRKRMNIYQAAIDSLKDYYSPQWPSKH